MASSDHASDTSALMDEAVPPRRSLARFSSAEARRQFAEYIATLDAEVKEPLLKVVDWSSNQALFRERRLVTTVIPMIVLAQCVLQVFLSVMDLVFFPDTKEKRFLIAVIVC
eukprot:m.141678 g.141678  ORF g.141678 m.141678 type:complete len:112 (-) comp10024_c0_seq3:1801-2136(-)